MVKIGLLGSGFVADFYIEVLHEVPGTQVAANHSHSDEAAKEFGRRHGEPRQSTRIEDLCVDNEVQMVVIPLPNHLHPARNPHFGGSSHGDRLHEASCTQRRRGTTDKQPREDFVDGYIVNCVLDAAYKSMKSGRWEPVDVDPGVTG